MVTDTQVKTGYMETEVGIIPRDWDVEEFGDICGLSKAKINPVTTKINYKCIELEHLESGTGRLLGYANSRELKSQKNIFEKGDTLFGKLRPYLRKFYFPNFDGVCTTEIWVLKSNNNVSKEWLYYLVQSNIVLESANQSIGSKMPRAEWNTVKKTLVPIPTAIAEQEAIAYSLRDIDGLILKLDQLIEKKRNIKQGTMQKLLTGKRRLPGFSGEWVAKRLGELLAYEQPTKYLVSSTEYDDNNSTPVLTAGKTFILGYTDEQKNVFSNLPTIIFDDFTTASKYVDFPFKVKSSAMKILNPRNSDINLRFVFEKMQIINFMVGDHKRHWISEYQDMEIDMPKIDEQNAIAQVLANMTNEIDYLEKQRNKYLDVKQGMMQQLLTGRIRLI